MYATAGGKPQTWDSQQQATVQMQYNNSMNWGFWGPYSQVVSGILGSYYPIIRKSRMFHSLNYYGSDDPTAGIEVS